MKELYNLRRTGALRNVHDYREVVARECFDGEISLESKLKARDLTLTRGASTPVSVLSFNSTIDSSMRRSWSHVRTTGQHAYLIWIVLCGQLRISHAFGSYVSKEGNITVLDSTTPFVSEALVDKFHQHKSIYAVVPAHIFLRKIPDFRGMAGVPYDAENADGRVINQVLKLLFQEGDDISKQAGFALLESALTSLHDLVQRHRGSTNRPMSVRDVRLQRVQGYIDGHLTDPGLSATRAAAALGITTRYMRYLLKDCGCTFSSMVNDKRNNLAINLLNSNEINNISLKEISMMAGYKNQANFSRCFKKINGQNPREFRRKSLSTGL